APHDGLEKGKVARRPHSAAGRLTHLYGVSEGPSTIWFTRALNPPGGPLETATKPDAGPRVRSKRSSTTRPESKAAPTPSRTRNGEPPAGVHTTNGSVVELQARLAHAELERRRTTELLAQAEEDLDTAHQRLVDADATRRHLLDNVASGGDEARRRFATVLHDDVLQQLTAAELQLERIRMD